MSTPALFFPYVDPKNRHSKIKNRENRYWNTRFFRVDNQAARRASRCHEDFDGKSENYVVRVRNYNDDTCKYNRLTRSDFSHFILVPKDMSKSLCIKIKSKISDIFLPFSIKSIPPFRADFLQTIPSF